MLASDCISAGCVILPTALTTTSLLLTSSIVGTGDTVVSGLLLSLLALCIPLIVLCFENMILWEFSTLVRHHQGSPVPAGTTSPTRAVNIQV